MDIRTCRVVRSDKEYVHQEPSMAKLIPEDVRAKCTFVNDRTKFNIEKSRQLVFSGKYKPGNSKNKNPNSKKNGRSANDLCGWKITDCEDDMGITSWVNKLNDRSRNKKASKPLSGDEECFRSQRGHFPKQCPSIENYFLFERESLPQRYVKNTQVTKFDSQTTPRTGGGQCQDSETLACGDGKVRKNEKSTVTAEPSMSSTGVQTSSISPRNTRDVPNFGKLSTGRSVYAKHETSKKGNEPICVSRDAPVNFSDMTSVQDVNHSVGDERYVSKADSAIKEEEEDVDFYMEGESCGEEGHGAVFTARSGVVTNRSCIKLQYTQGNTSRTGSVYADSSKSSDANTVTESIQESRHSATSASSNISNSSRTELRPLTLVLKKITIVNDNNMPFSETVHDKITPRGVRRFQGTSIAERDKENIDVDDNSSLTNHPKFSGKESLLPPSLQKYNSKEYVESLSNATNEKRSVRSPKSFLKSASGLKNGGVAFQLKDLLPAVETNIRYSFPNRNYSPNTDPTANSLQDFSDSVINIDGMKLLQNGINLLDDSMDRHICPPFMRPKNSSTQQTTDITKKIIPSPNYPPLYPTPKAKNTMTPPLGRISDRTDDRRVQSEKAFNPVQYLSELKLEGTELELGKRRSKSAKTTAELDKNRLESGKIDSDIKKPP